MSYSAQRHSKPAYVFHELCLSITMLFGENPAQHDLT